MRTLVSRFILVSLFTTSLVMLNGCENAELRECKEKASQLWDSTKDNPKDNKAYWDAIERCKEKYG